MIGIYIINNKVTSEKYVGSSKHVEKRLKTHVAMLNKGSHHSGKLQLSWNEWGKDSFEMYTVEQTSTHELIEREQFWIDFFNSYDNGFNMIREAGGVPEFVKRDSSLPNKIKHRKPDKYDDMSLELRTIPMVIYELGFGEEEHIEMIRKSASGRVKGSKKISKWSHMTKRLRRGCSG